MGSIGTDPVLVACVLVNTKPCPRLGCFRMEGFDYGSRMAPMSRDGISQMEGTLSAAAADSQLSRAVTALRLAGPDDGTSGPTRRPNSSAVQVKVH